MCNMCPASAHGSVPLYHNSAMPNNDKRRKLNDYVEGDHCPAEFPTALRPPLHNHHAYRAVGFVPLSHQSANLPFLGYPPPVNLPLQRSPRNGLPQHQTPLPSDNVINDNKQHRLMPPLPRQRNGPSFPNYNMTQNLFMPPFPAQGNMASVRKDHFRHSPFIPPVPVQDNRPLNSDKGEFGIPGNGAPVENTLSGKRLSDWVGGRNGDQQQYQIGNVYMPQASQDGQGQNYHLQNNMVQDLELPREFHLGAAIPAPPSPEPDAPQVLALPTPPPLIPNAHQRMCKVPGCDQPTFAQTKRSSKCRDHMENPPPQSREAALVEAVATGHGYCSGCNGLRPRRAPGRSCWDCHCKNRRQNFGVCDGCPGSRCPNRVAE